MAVFVGGAAEKPIYNKMLGNYAESDIVYINEGGKLVEFYVSKHDYESGLNGAGRTLLVRKDCYDKRQWDTSNVNAYESSSIDSWLNGTYKNLLDTGVQNALETTSFYFMTSNTGNVVTLDRAVFMLSVTELGVSYAFAGTVGSKLPIADALKVAHLNGVAVDQWTRNARAARNNISCFLKSDGSVGESACNVAYGSRPCFTLPSTALFSGGDNSFVSA